MVRKLPVIQVLMFIYYIVIIIVHFNSLMDTCWIHFPINWSFIYMYLNVGENNYEFDIWQVLTRWNRNILSDNNYLFDKQVWNENKYSVENTHNILICIPYWTSIFTQPYMILKDTHVILICMLNILQCVNL